MMQSRSTTSNTRKSATMRRRQRSSCATTSSSPSSFHSGVTATMHRSVLISVLMIATLVSLSSFGTSSAFQLSMVSSSTPKRGPLPPPAFSPSRRSGGSSSSSSTSRRGAAASSSASTATASGGSVKKPLRDPFSLAAATLVGGFDVSSSLISGLAVAALKTRLAAQTHVSCDVKSKSAAADLLVGGHVGPVTVKGRGWRSRLGLSCRAIEATVERCELDIGKVVSKRKLRLTKPAEGKAMIALNAEDFGNFVTHPLVKPPPVHEDDDGVASPIEFRRDGASIDPAAGTVTFLAKYMGQDWECTLKRGAKAQRRAVIVVRPVAALSEDDIDATTSMRLTESLTKFFNNMVFELDGVFLNFRDMMVTSSSSVPTVMLSLNLVVHKFPSTKAAF